MRNFMDDDFLLYSDTAKYCKHLVNAVCSICVYLAKSQ